MLEAMAHRDSVFVTLTYDNDNLPSDLSVSKREAQLFLKRLRYLLQGREIRYYLVGEYGTQSGRPHYHAILFGVSDLDTPNIEKAWQRGFVHVGTVTVESAGYCVAYISNARTKKEQMIGNLAGRTPEFSIMSRKPGIGSAAIQTLAGSLKRVAGVEFGDTKRDVPGQYRLGNRKYPLGRLLTGKLRIALGFAQSGEPISQRELRCRERIEEAYRLTTARILEIDNARRRSAQLKAQQAAKFSYLKGNKI